MKLKIFQCLLLTIGVFLPISCKPDKGLDNTIRSSVRDKTITIEEWSEIVKLAEDENKCISQNGNGSVDTNLLIAYVKDYGTKKMRGIDSIVFPDDLLEQNAPVSIEKIKFKFFLERSGSMVFYDAQGTSGNFKNAIAHMLNGIPNNASDKHLLYVVNDGVHIYKKTFKDFVQSNIFKDTKDMGDSRYTDFARIFDSVFNRTASDEVSILVSDLTYSTRTFSGLSPEAIANEAMEITRSTFKNHENKDVVVIKMHSDYVGQYYPYNSPNVGFFYRDDRPYYFVIVASPSLMEKIFTDETFKDFRHFQSYKGFENYYCFSKGNTTPDFSVLFNHEYCKGRFKAKKGSKVVHDIEKLQRDKREKITSLVIAMDLSKIITEPDYLEDINNYEVRNSLSGFEVKRIERILPENMTDNIKKYVPNATHLMVISTAEPLKNETITIALKDKLPEWVAQSSMDDDSDAKSDGFSRKTFAFLPLMEGIYYAFHSTTETPEHFAITINISR